MKEKLPKQKDALNLLLGKVEPRDGFTKIKTKLDFQTLEKTINQLFSLKNKAISFLTIGMLPRNYSELLSANLLYYKQNTLEQELYWNTLFIVKYASEINKFIQLRDAFEVELIRGKYDSANEFLANIENDICFSLWSLENRFILKEYMSGLEANKEFLNEINSSKCDNLLIWIADIFSYKAEKTIVEPQYRNRMEKLLERIKDKVFNIYIKSKIYGFEICNNTQLSNILFCEHSSSIIDRYLTLLKVCQVSCAIEIPGSKVLHAVKKCILILSNSINDQMLTNLKISFNSDQFGEPRKVDYMLNKIGDNYTKGDYALVIQQCTEIFNDYANHLELYEYYVKASLHLGRTLDFSEDQNSIMGSLLRSMYESYIKKPESIIENYHTLSRIIRAFNSNSFGISLCRFFNSRFSVEAVDDLQKIDIMQRLATLNSQHANARFCLFYLENNERVNYLYEHKKIYGDKLQTNLFLKYYTDVLKTFEDINIDEIPAYRRDWYKLKAKMVLGKYEDSKEALCKIYDYYRHEKNSNVAYYHYERVVIGLFNIRLKTKDIKSCLDLFVTNYLENKFLASRLDRIMLFKEINKSLSKELKANIALSILTHICCKNQNIELYTACANFLDSNSYSTPAELIQDQSSYELNKLVYFLRYVCIPEIMDSMYCAFNSEEEVDSERIEICQALRTLNPENDSIYINEISQITQKYSLTRRIKILDDSKIDFDLRSIRLTKKEIFSENYKRYIEIGNFDISYNILDVNDSKVVFINYFDKKDHGAITEKKNQKYVLFKEMFYDYRDELAFGQYGLDSSLSTRIRHGRLQNHIRKVFEQYQLVNSKENYNSSKYLPDKNLNKILLSVGFDKRFINLLHAIFADFSKKIDDIIDEINASAIRIKTENLNPNGMFDLSFKEEELLLLFTNCAQINNEELLLDKFDKKLMMRIENSLNLIRNYIKMQLKQRLINNINELEEKIVLHFEGSSNSKLCVEIIQNIANCRTEIQRETNKIAEWFKLPPKQEYSNFNLQQLLETCLVVCKKLHTSFNDVTINIDNNTNLLLKGYTFSYFTEIFVILFTNAIIHSGYLHEIKNLEIKLILEENENCINIRMLNNLSPDLDRDDVVARIKKVHKRIHDSADSRKYYSHEGGSGYVKITKMLTYNIATTWELQSGVNSNGDYWVHIVLEKSKIVDGGVS